MYVFIWLWRSLLRFKQTFMLLLLLQLFPYLFHIQTKKVHFNCTLTPKSPTFFVCCYCCFLYSVCYSLISLSFMYFRFSIACPTQNTPYTAVMSCFCYMFSFRMVLFVIFLSCFFYPISYM